MKISFFVSYGDTYWTDEIDTDYDFSEDGIEYDEDGVAWWFDEDEEIWYYYDEESEEWYEYGSEDCYGEESDW